MATSFRLEQKEAHTRPRQVVATAFLAASLALAASRASGLNRATALSQYGRDLWDSDSGLPQNSVDAILQTRDGYLWLGTQEGLIRFDGVRFRIFDSRNTPAMRDDWVLSFCETRDGTLWVGTAEGLLRGSDGRFDGWQPDGPLAGGMIRSLVQARDGALWAASNDGVVRLEGHSTRLFTEKDGLPGRGAFSVAEDSRGRIWAGTGNGLAVLREARFEPVRVYEESAAPAVMALQPDPDGDLWVGTARGLVRLSDGGRRAYGAADGLTNSRVQALYRDSQGILWVGTAGGLFRLWEGYFEPLSRENGGLSSSDIDSVCEDREGSLWIGTRDGGLNRLKDERIANYTTRQGLPDDRVWTAFEDRAGTLWVGTADGGLSRLAPRAAGFEIFARLGARVVSMDQDSAGDLWVGTLGSGLYRIHGRETIRYGKDQGFAPPFVSSLCADRNGGVWIGTSGSGLYFYRGGKFTRYTEQDGLASNRVFSLYQDRAGTIWAGTFGGGVSRLRDGKFSNWTTRDGLAHDIVMSILEDQSGAFWFGTRGGLSRWSGGRFTTYREATGLFHDAVQKVLADDRGYLWLTSNHGIFRVSLEEVAAAAAGGGRILRSVGFTTGNGMRSVECNNGQHGGFRGRDGRLWFATLKGLAMADPAHIRLNAVPPKVVIEAVKSGRQTFAAVSGIMLAPAQRDLEFQYTALSFKNPSAIRFRYRLEGFDRGWVEAGARRAAYYTNLPPGHLRFRVIASNEDGVWSEGGAVSEVTLSRSLFETAWFRILCAAAGLLLVWSAHRLRVRRLAAREAVRSALFEARLSALQAQLQPHFLFNALNSLLPLVGSEPGRARRMILRLGDLLRASLVAETTQLVTLERDLTLLDEYLDIERMRFRDRIQTDIEADETARSAQVPSFLLQPLVENAIKHGADPRTGRVRIQIEASAGEGSLSLTIRDDGPGIRESGAGERGIGLTNIRRRLEMLYPGRHFFRLANREGGGCEVSIRVPLSFDNDAKGDPSLSEKISRFGVVG